MYPPTLRILYQYTPELLLLLTGLLFMLAAIDKRAREAAQLKLAAVMTACGTAFFAGLQFFAARGAVGEPLPGVLNDQLAFVSLTSDGFALAFRMVILIGLALSVVLTLKDDGLEDPPTAEYYALMFFAALGMGVMAAGRDLLTLWVGLEVMALSTYALIALPRRDRRAPEGAMKYFILGTLSSGVYLYGASLLYGASGSIGFVDASNRPLLASGIAQALAAGGPRAALAGLGVVLLLVALLFKVGAVPFHMWLPDAYTGAPTAITNFMSVSVKTASFAMLLRILYEGLPTASAIWLPLVGLAAVVTMLWGNIAAVRQDNVKRMLAYSSIAHAGYILAGVTALGASRTGETMAWVYLLLYTFMNSAAFALVIGMRGRGLSGESYDDYAGLSARAPGIAYGLLYLMLALTGIPATAGFTAKFAVFGAVVDGGHAAVAALGLLASAISLFYYFRLVVQAFVKPAESRPAPAFGLSAALVFAIGLATTLWFAFAFGPVMRRAAFAKLGERPEPVLERTGGAPPAPAPVR